MLGCWSKKRERKISLSAVKHVICMCTVEWPIPLGVCAWIHAVSGFLMLCVVLVSVRCNGSQKHIYIPESALELELRAAHRSRKSPVLWCTTNSVFLSLYKEKFSVLSHGPSPLRGQGTIYGRFHGHIITLGLFSCCWWHLKSLCFLLPCCGFAEAL